MSAYLYIEGGASGANSKELSIRCQQAFHSLLDRMGFKGRKPRLVACGSRGAVYDRFCTAHQALTAGFVAMWIDSEDPVGDVEKTWTHLKHRDNWDQPVGAVDEQVLFMTTCMETLIVADRATLRIHYGRCLHDKSLPPPDHLENRNRAEVLQKLVEATRSCANTYAKGKRSFEVLALLSPSALSALPSFARTVRVLHDRL